MAFTFAITNAVAQAILTAYAAQVDAGTAAVIEIRTGSQPGPGETATGTLLATLTMSATAFGSPADENPGASITADTITDDSSADATGTAGHFRVLTQSGGTAISEGSVGTSGADLNMNTLSITAGSTVSISSFVVNMPESAS